MDAVQGVKLVKPTDGAVYRLDLARVWLFDVPHNRHWLHRLHLRQHKAVWRTGMVPACTCWMN